MIILHIAAIKDTKCSGVGVVVPQYVLSQQKSNDVALINVFNIKISEIEKQLYYKKGMNVYDLPMPFNKPDLVIFHELYYVDYLRVYRSIQKQNIPFIIVPHGGLTEKAQTIKYLKKKIANILLFNRFFKAASAIQFLSEDEKNESREFNYSFVIPNGMSLKKQVPMYNEKIVFTYIGRIDLYHKGLDLLINAININKEKLIKKKICVNLYGPETSDSFEILQLIKKRNLQSILCINGAVTGIKKEEILLRTTYFLQTSRFEGLPMGILEALSYGIPCCVTNGTNMSKYIKNYKAGFTASDNPNSIANMLISAIENADKVKIMSDNAKQIIEDCFSWEKVCKKSINEYSNILGRKN